MQASADRPTTFANDIGDKFTLDDVSEKVAAAQTAIYALMSRADLPKDATLALVRLHGDLGTVVYDTMTGRPA